MALKSNASLEQDDLYFYDIYTQVQTIVKNDHYKRDFVVVPSPANNTGGPNRRFSPYSFDKRVERGCRGEQVYGQWGRDPLDTTSTTQWLEWGSYGCYGLGTSWGRYTLTPSVNSQNTARNKALEQLYDGIRHSEISLNTSLGESRETFEMLHNIVQRFKTDKYRTLITSTQELVRALRRDSRKTLSSGWLGWHVGWKPFLQDISNIFQHFTTLQTQPHLDFVGVTKARASERDVQTKFGGGTLESYTASYRYEFGVRYRIENLALFNTWQLGLTARPTLVWELTSLSFVIDYFINIGQYLALLEAGIANNGITLLDGYQTYSSRQQWSSAWSTTSPRPPYPGAGGTTGAILIRGSNDCTLDRTVKERSILTSLPIPVMPTFKIPKASEQLLTCAALLSGLIPTKER